MVAVPKVTVPTLFGEEPSIPPQHTFRTYFTSLHLFTRSDFLLATS